MQNETLRIVVNVARCVNSRFRLSAAIIIGLVFLTGLLWSHNPSAANFGIGSYSGGFSYGRQGTSPAVDASAQQPQKGKLSAPPNSVNGPNQFGCLLAPPPKIPINFGLEVKSSLSYGDEDYCPPVYVFSGTAGQRVSISLSSTDFDALLGLYGPDGNLVTSDDNGGGGTNSRIPAGSGFLTLQTSGTYTIVASSKGLQPGGFTLSLIAPQTQEERAIDDGSAESGFSENEAIFVNRLTPTAYPATLQIIRIFFWQFSNQPDPSGKDIRLIVFTGAPGTDRPPGNPKLMVDKIVSVPAIQNGGSFADFPISNGPTITNGDFYVGFQIPNTGESVGAWFDSNGPQNKRGFFKRQNESSYFGPMTTGSGQDVNLMIRAVMLSGGANTCNFTRSSSPGKFAASGGIGNVSVTASSSCVWHIVSDVNWITFPSGNSGIGNGSVSYNVAPNTTTNQRNGYIGFAGQAFPSLVTQDSICSYTISPTSANVLASGGVGNVNVAAPTGCDWIAGVLDNWLSITSGSIGSGNGVVSYSAQANPNTSQRQGRLRIAEQIFTVTQAGAACAYVISPASANVPAAGGSSSVNVTALNGCNWTATSNDSWLSVTGAGSGNGVANYTAQANASANQRQGSLTIAGKIFTVTQAGAPQTTARVLRIAPASGAPGGQVSVPVELVSQGDESAMGFSLTFDPAALSNPQVALGSDASGASLNPNTGQASQGRVGVVLSLPSGQTFSAGVRQVVVVNFTITANAMAGLTNIGFGDQPVPREISDPSANSLSANYTGNVVTITQGLEADVSPRPSGNGSVTVTDWVQIGRFVAGIETLAPGGEFQRADCAPKDTLGNGALTATDWVQAGRYAAGIDSPVLAGGPTAPNSLAGNDPILATQQSVVANQPARIVRIAPASLERGQNGSVVIEIEAQGGESALGFSLSFDTAQLQFISASVGRDATGATLNVNSSQAGAGRVGIVLALPTGQSLSAGARQIVVLNFASAANGNATATTLSFGDQPVAREIADANARAVAANFNNGSITLTRTVTAVSAASFLGAELAPESIVAAFGSRLATEVKVANTIPLPTDLAGTKVTVKDSAGVERQSPLFFVAPNQINYLTPSGAASGAATITVTSGDGAVSTGKANIAMVAPALFTANSNGQGVAAAVALRVKPNGAQTFEPIAQFDPAQNRMVPIPIDLGPEGDQVFLILYGTGLRFRSNLSAVTASVGGVNSQVFYAGVAEGFVGLDQINLSLPRSLAGRGDVEIKLTADGKAANTVTVRVK
jgi:uncharacterized protein (TIGR03437 family)